MKAIAIVETNKFGNSKSFSFIEAFRGTGTMSIKIRNLERSNI